MLSTEQGLVNVPIEHHPSIGDIISNRYLKVMFKIPKKGHLPTPAETQSKITRHKYTNKSLKKTQMLRHGSLNVPIEHHPTIGYMVYNGYYKVMSNIPKMGHLQIPVRYRTFS